jgi:hypothetical protein
VNTITIGRGASREALRRFTACDLPKRMVIAADPARWEGVAGVDRVISVEQSIEYRFFYPMISETDKHTAYFLDEPLKLKNRNDLVYNCIRNIINSAGQVHVFQTVPMLDEQADFMVLFDLVTRSQWKRNKFEWALIREHARVALCDPITPGFDVVEIPSQEKTRRVYAEQRERLFAELGLRDPLTVPSALGLLPIMEKANWVMDRAMEFPRESTWLYLRNARADKLLDRGSWCADPAQARAVVFLDFPVKMRTLRDVVASLPVGCRVVFPVTDLKVDGYYMDIMRRWEADLNELQAGLQGV